MTSPQDRIRQIESAMLEKRIEQELICELIKLAYELGMRVARQERRLTFDEFFAQNYREEADRR